MNVVNRIGISASAIALAACTTAATSQTPPFGDADSVRYAEQVWQQLSAAKLAGQGSVVSKPYQGQHPHGAVLDTIEGSLRVGGHSGTVIVKRNYGGEGASIASVANDPDAYLKAVTVMYRREAGYDPDNKDWFWAKFNPDGSLAKNPKGTALAGRVAKGAAKGCIACHKAAPGGDLVFNNDRYAR